MNNRQTDRISGGADINDVKSMIEANRINERFASYNLFSYFFLALPNEEFVNKVLNLHFENAGDEESQRGVELIRQYIVNCRVKTLAAVFQELSIDRTQLLRGLTENGPRPPYESVYLKLQSAEVMGSLNTFYAQANYGVSKDIHESGEQIGIELSFMRELCRQELKARNEGACREAMAGIRRLQRDFLYQHLGRWAGLFASEMIEFSKTDFYKGVGFLLQDFIIEEMAGI